MATVTKWTPFGVALDVTATGSNVKRTSATKFTVDITASWETYYDGAQTNYGMSATSGGVTQVISAFGTKRSNGTKTFTGTYSISGNGSATKTITVTFKNYEEDWQGNVTKSATKNVTFNVTVPAWTSYTVSYNANGGSGAPGSQTKWKDQVLTLSSTKPTRTGYSFLGWATSSSATSATYSAGGKYTANSGATLYAVWKANTYTVSYNANGGTGAPSNQTKTYGVTLTLSNTKPTRANYNFKGWGTSASATTVAYSAGASYSANAATTLYAIWELAYVKPRITGLSIDRCDLEGTLHDDGTYARVNFNWATDYAVTAIKIWWKLTTTSSWGNPVVLSPGGTSGSTNYIAGAGALDVDHTYDFLVEVHDSNGYSYLTSTLSGTAYVIDILANGNGLALGKPAEHDGVFEVGYATRFTGGVNGNLHVTDGTTSFPDLKFKASYQGTGVDFNDYKTSGIFGIYGTCSNSPTTQIGILIVNAYSNDWVHQEFIDIENVSRYERTFYLGTTWSAWKKTEDKRRVYNDTAIITPLVIGSGNYSLKLGVNNNYELVWVYQSGGSSTGSKWFAPVTDGGVLLGSSSYRWGQIYSTTSTIATSDRNQKQDFEDFDDRYEAFFAKLKPQLFKFKDGTSDRKHSGFISQDVEEAMLEVGLTDKDFAGFCKDIKQNKTGENEETGEISFADVYDDNGNPVYNYSLRYDEFIALNTHMIHKQQAEIEALKLEIQELKRMCSKNLPQVEGAENV